MPVRGNELNSQKGRDDMSSVAHYVYCCVYRILAEINKQVHLSEFKRK